MLGISENQFSDGTLEFYGNINLMKGAINNSDIVTTVSPTYSREIMTDFFGENLHNVLKSNEYKVFGILNGIDQKIYNPQNDSFINSNYDISSINKKFENKRFIQEKLSLETNPSAPVISMISRFDEMKGFDLIIKVFDELMDENIQMIILGVGESKYENFFKSRQDRYKGKFSLNTVFDEALAHEIYAGSDMFLMPSKFEPCGLSQQISMAYGTVPIVRETGGLKDTVTPYNKYDETGNGFSFGSYNAHEMLFAIKRALEIYPVKDKWQKIVESAMNFNSSWKVSANKYIELYNKLLEKSDDY
jgi:starch synthase